MAIKLLGVCITLCIVGALAKEHKSNNAFMLRNGPPPDAVITARNGTRRNINHHNRVKRAVDQDAIDELLFEHNKYRRQSESSDMYIMVKPYLLNI